MAQTGWFILRRGRTSDEFLEGTLNVMGVQTTHTLSTRTIELGNGASIRVSPPVA